MVVRAQKEAAVTGTSTQPRTIMSADRMESHRRGGEAGAATGSSGPVGAPVVVVGTGTVSPLLLMPTSVLAHRGRRRHSSGVIRSAQALEHLDGDHPGRRGADEDEACVPHRARQVTE